MVFVVFVAESDCTLCSSGSSCALVTTDFVRFHLCKMQHID
jgi:hypothetical protein